MPITRPDPSDPFDSPSGASVVDELADAIEDTTTGHDHDGTDSKKVTAASVLITDAAGDFTATEVEGALAEVQSDNEAHLAAADPHTGYLKEADIAAKGDLFAGTANDTVGILTAGTNFLDVLLPDSTATQGLRWGKPRSGLRPTGSLFETIGRGAAIVNNAVLSTGRVSVVAIDLPSGLLVTSISFVSITTAAGTPTNQVFGLYDSSRALLRSTADDTTTAWAANTVKTLNLTSTFTTTYSGLHYLAILVVATTVPSLATTAISNVTVNTVAPIVAGTSDTGVTAMPNPAAAFTPVTLFPWAWVS